MNSPILNHAWDAFCSRLYDQNQFAIKLGLKNIQTALTLEGSPEKAYPGIVVGGTNGKGETAATISKILTHCGLHVGLFTSPHLIELRERFRINGKPAPKSEVLEVGEYVLNTYADPHTCQQHQRPCLTFFELTTLVAALLFRQRGVDVVVWEVGLGGRLDSTNAIDPTLTVITNIGIDHEQYLGHTITDIAAEKAGLIRQNRPVIVAQQSHDEALRTICDTNPHTLHYLGSPEQLHRRHQLDLKTSLPTALSNRYTGWRTAELFLEALGGEKGRVLKENNHQNLFQDALSQLTWWGRHQELHLEETTFFLDGAHNPQGIQALREHLTHTHIDAIFFAAMKDKDLTTMFSWLQELTCDLYFVDLQSQRAASYQEIQPLIPNQNLRHLHQTSHILDIVTQNAYRSVACFGSLYFIGEILDALGFQTDDLVI